MFADVNRPSIPRWSSPAAAPEYLRNGPHCQRIVAHFFAADKPVAQLCHGPLISAAAGVLGGRGSAAYPAPAPEVAAAGGYFTDGAAVVDGTPASGRAGRSGLGCGKPGPIRGISGLW